MILPHISDQLGKGDVEKPFTFCWRQRKFYLLLQWFCLQIYSDRNLQTNLLLQWFCLLFPCNKPVYIKKLPITGWYASNLLYNRLYQWCSGPKLFYLHLIWIPSFSYAIRNSIAYSQLVKWLPTQFVRIKFHLRKFDTVILH